MKQRFENTLFYEINLSSKYFNALFEQLFREMEIGISALENLALSTIIKTSDCCQRDLAKIILKDRANTGKLVNRLKDKGLIVIEQRIKNNRMVKILTPTEKGVKTYNKVKKLLEPLIEKLESESSHELMESTTRALRKFRNMVQTALKVNI